MEQLAALLTFHVITCTAAAIVNADIFIAGRRFIVYEVLIHQSVTRKTVKTPVDSRSAYIYTLRPEMLFDILGSQMLTAVVLHELQDLGRLLGVICSFRIARHQKTPQNAI